MNMEKCQTTFALIPTFSPGRRRNVASLREFAARYFSLPSMVKMFSTEQIEHPKSKGDLRQIPSLGGEVSFFASDALTVKMKTFKNPGA
jgi:hypothetical protein